MEERFVGIRIQTVKNLENFEERLKHNSRYKKDKRVVNGNGIYTDKRKRIFEINSSQSVEILEEAKSTFDHVRKEHKKLDKHFRDKRSKSLIEGILYFSEGINEDFENDKNGFFDRVERMLNELNITQKTEVLNWYFHTDEKGNYHLHFIAKNYNMENGKSLNFTRNKEQGAFLQDLCFKHFKDFGKGYQRGIEKERPVKYLNPHEYEEYAKSKELIEKTKKELEATKTTLKEKEEEIEALKAQKEELTHARNEIRKELLFIIQEFEEMAMEFEDFILEEEDRNKLEKLKKLFTRYSKNENKERMLSTLNKTKKTAKKIKDKYTRKTQR